MKDQIIDQIESVRRKNNSLWMQLLSIALEEAPERTQKVLADINKNDRKISNLMGMLANDGDSGS